MSIAISIPLPELVAFTVVAVLAGVAARSARLAAHRGSTCSTRCITDDRAAMTADTARAAPVVKNAAGAQAQSTPADRPAHATTSRVRKVGAHKPDVAVIDVRMPPTHTDEGLRAAHRIRHEHPGTGVLVLSQYVDEAYALDLLSETTASTGYLLKDRIADVATFTDAVQRVAKGGSALDPEVVALLLGRRGRDDPLAVLTPREREVLALMAEGRSNTAMAGALMVTERAVEKHVTSIFSKLDLPRAVHDHRRVLAVLRFLRSS